MFFLFAFGSCSFICLRKIRVTFGFSFIFLSARVAVELVALLLIGLGTSDAIDVLIHFCVMLDQLWQLLLSS